jgi:acetylornithine/succinyldiaminopimelate/putrescine aminotransferase
MNQSDQIKSLFDQYVMPTYARSIALVRGDGVRCWDAEGKEYLDFGAGVAVNILGHTHPAMVKAISQALKDQSRKLIHCSNLYYSEPQGLLAKRIVELVGVAGKCFFCNSGAEANEALYKLARRFFHLTRNETGSTAVSAPERVGQASSLSNSEMGKLEARPTLCPEILTMLGSFHGRTLAGISATGQDKIKKGFEPMVDGFRHVPLNDLKAVEAAIRPQTAAILVEPIQGENGVRPATPEFLRGLRALCDTRNLLLMYDEVQCGNARTGKFFGFQTIAPDAPPDALSMAKGLGGGVPIGAIWASAHRTVPGGSHSVATDPPKDATERVPPTLLCDILGPGTHASTFGGTPLVCSVALAVLDTLEKKNIAANVERRGKQLMRGLKALQKKFPVIKEVRGYGLMLGVELNVEVKDFIARCAAEGLLVVAAGTHTFRLVPPLIISKADADEALAKLEKALTV